MIARPLSEHVLRFAAVCLALAVPLLFLGRALLGVSLGLSFLATLYAGSHRENWDYIRQNLPKSHAIGLCILVFATGVNVPFSLDILKSFESWSRTWIVLAIIVFLLVSLRQNIKLILYVCSIAIIAIIVFHSVILLQYYYELMHKFEIELSFMSKNVINAYLLTLPIVALFFSRYFNIRWILILFILFILIAIAIQAKATIAGALLLIVISIFHIFRDLSRKHSLLICLLTIIVLAGIAWTFGNFYLWQQGPEFEAFAFLPTEFVDLHRQIIWRFAFDLWQLNPMIGFGINAGNYHPLSSQTVGEFFGETFTIGPLLNTSIYPSHPHNWVMEMLVDMGLIGTIPTVLAVIWIFWRTLSAYFNTQNMGAIALLAINAGYWGTGLLNFSFWSVWWLASYFILAGIALMVMIENDNAD